MSLDRALTTTAPARARLERIYGRVPAVIAFLQRDDGPITIHRCLRLVGTVEKLYRASDEEVIVHAAVPGGRAFEGWIRRRVVRVPQTHLAGVGQSMQRLHEIGFEAEGEITAATIHMLRRHDPFLADFERLYLNGTTYPEMAGISGLTENQVKATLERMRRLGFELPFRLGYTRRTSV